MLRLVAAASSEPVSLAQAKQHLREISAARDELIALWITAAREEVELQTGYALADATWEWTPVGERTGPLPVWPGTVTSAAGAVPIVFKATPGPVPAALRAAILLRLDDLSAHSSAGSTEPLSENPAMQSLMFPFRRVLP